MEVAVSPQAPAAPVVYIKDLPSHVGQEVTVRGWVQHHRAKGKLQFIVMRDGSGICQLVAFKGDLAEADWEAAGKLTLESSFAASGTVRADERAPGGVELALHSVDVLQYAQDYPIAEKEHGVGFLMENRHLWLRSTRQNAALKVRASVVKAVRDFLDDRGFTLVDAPILTPNACEGTSNLFETDYFGVPAFLSQSGQLYNEAAIGSLGKVYCFGPTFRAEKSKTRRHLMEFWMVEPEVAFLELDGLLELEEQFISFIVQRVLETRQEELKVLERDTSKLERIVPPFPRISYDDAITYLQQTVNPEATWGDDFGGDEETALGSPYDKPVFITRYPTNIKAFYMQPDAARPEVVLAADLIAPEGYGEICGGSQRIHDLALIQQRIQEHDLPRAAFEWYMDVRRYGSVPHSGFGMGIERMTAWVGGLPHVRETIPFPRMYEWCRP
ncbi:MAG TPA: asparagine--tRNA ligase [Chloroflexia bacterium]|nr:asparagine--tRNA ligase [Chloroflexia bacterium]